MLRFKTKQECPEKWNDEGNMDYLYGLPVPKELLFIERGFIQKPNFIVKKQREIYKTLATADCHWQYHSDVHTVEGSRFETLVVGDIIRCTNEIEYNILLTVLHELGYNHVNDNNFLKWEYLTKNPNGSELILIEPNKKYFYYGAYNPPKDKLINLDWLLHKTDSKYYCANDFKIGDRVRINPTLKDVPDYNKLSGLNITPSMKYENYYGCEYTIDSIYTGHNAVKLVSSYCDGITNKIDCHLWPISYLIKVDTGKVSIGSSNTIKVENTNKLNINQIKQQTHGSIKIQRPNFKISVSNRIRGIGLTSTRSQS